MKRVILTAVATMALFATQASAQSAWSYGAPAYGYHNSGYATHNYYQHIGNLDNYASSYTRPIVSAGYRTSSFPSYVSQPYTLPNYTTPTYAQPASYRTPTYRYPSYNYTYPSYNYGSYNYGTRYATPASYRGVVSTVPYTGGYSGSYNCGC